MQPPSDDGRRMDDLDLSLPAEFHLRQLAIRNYRGIDELVLPFSHRLTVLIGENGAGKTTVLDAVAAAMQGLSGKPDEDLEAFRLTPRDVRRAGGEAVGPACVEAWVAGGQSWGVRRGHDARAKLERFAPARSAGPDRPLSEAPALALGEPDLPVFAYYDAERSYTGRRLTRSKRRGASAGGLDAAGGFPSLVAWFQEKDVEEARTIRDASDLSYRHPQLQAVRDAVTSIIPAASNLRVDPRSKRLTVDLEGGSGSFDLVELAGGVRTMLVTVADLARRMVHANPEVGTGSPGLVLIDEIDLHLHPRWQLTIVESLLRAFPRAQFVVTTHSDQVVASVPSERLVQLRPTPDGVRAFQLGPVSGASFVEVLQDAMGLETDRGLEARRALDRYWSLIRDGRGESEEARGLRRTLEEIFPGTRTELVRADFDLRRRRLDGRRGQGA